MKQVKNLIAIVVFTFIASSAFAQKEKNAAAPWVSDKGYWVVESNVKTPQQHTLRFYTNDDVLMYTETLSGVKLNLNKKKVKMQLKQALETSAIAWQQNKKAEADKDYVAAVLR